MSSPATTSDSTSVSLRTGDSLARAGDWVRALQEWHEAVTENVSLQPAVEQRLVWFLNETGEGGTVRRTTTGLRVLIMVVTAAAAAAFVLAAGEPGTTKANIWAVAAWFMIAISATCAVAGARAPRSESFEALMTRARTTANRLVDDTMRNG